MRSYVSGHQAVTDEDFAELALGTPLELWLGAEGETAEERAARLDAGRDILTDNPALPWRADRIADVIDNPDLAEIITLPRPDRRRPRSRKGAAA
ncbi:hypothetical protein G5C51_09385 [Streptomyces sp. A7024]|uniref:Uncharacterized protein n=1 Tax=Streptomyces coryli TaxID=1128680 RepID=A0A6G4TVV4_9ACTN|nr:hypothetical protein [Streptomyces coryli]NGN64115.1 hypothetical protein [Streptomyces coryli]